MAPLSQNQAIQTFDVDSITNTMNPFDPHTVLMHLYPRDRADNMGYAIHPTAIVFLVLLGTGFVVAMMYGMDRVSGFRGRPHEEPRHMSVEQARYLAEVRMRNMEALKEESRRGYGLGRGKRPA